MEHVGRNDPCPCGSGKKYKKCCTNVAAVNSFSGRFSIKGKAVIFALIVVFFLGLFLRYYGFGQPHGLTFDEGLYSGMLAKQLQVDPTNYSTEKAYEIIKASGRFTPEYLNSPLFKHPPVYSYLIALSYNLFGSSDLVAVSVSIWLGSLMVLIVFLLGKVLYDYRVGLLAAFILCIDPVHWVCSERIWMETTMSFFMLLAVYLFVLGQKQKIYLSLSGLSIGLAMLTKYPGILSLVIIVSYVVLTDRSLIKEKSFWLLCLLPFLVFSPWVIWNWKVSGGFFGALLSLHGKSSILQSAVQGLLEYKGALMIVLFGGGAVIFLRNKINSKLRKILQGVCFLTLALAFLATPSFRNMIAQAFVFKDTILVGWSYPFTGVAWHFYITRLVELSPVYLFAYASIFFVFGKNKGDRLLLLSSLLIFTAFIVLRNYQSRYILPAVPFLILLSARWQVWVFDKLSCSSVGVGQKSSFGAYRTLLKIGFVGVSLFFILQTLRTDALIAIGPDFGYF